MQIILWDSLILSEISLSPQVKRSVIISNKQRVAQELPNNLRLEISGNSEIRKNH